MEDKRVFPVVDLPDELIIAIFTHLRWRACLTLRAVSRTWLHLSEDDRLWLGHVTRKWGSEAKPGQGVRPRDYFRLRKLQEVKVVLRGQAWGSHQEFKVRVPRNGSVESVCVAAEAAARARGGGRVNTEMTGLRIRLRHAGSRHNDFLDPSCSLVSAGITQNGHPIAFSAVRSSPLSLSV